MKGIRYAALFPTNNTINRRYLEVAKRISILRLCISDDENVPITL